MDANIETTGTEGNERERHERHAGTADFIERARVNQKKLTLWARYWVAVQASTG
jgi:hypothetical protein